MKCRCCDNEPTLSPLFPFFAILVLVLAILVVGTPHVQYQSDQHHNESKIQHITIGK
ncbi:movement protein [Furcraea necrotic streak virus]|uniref:Movement protein n=1 Tax=Furcraea necrotic streak virus TaxID=676234 RepID=D3U5B7_9TOMB|nr:movement protein [Furcraea necrotic streak virus]ACW84410.1 movement protein [Furcraea necrotic streak virus]